MKTQHEKELARLNAGEFSASNFKLEKGNLYKVDIPEDNELLDWEAPLRDQPAGVQEKIAALFPNQEPKLIQSGNEFWVTRPWEGTRTDPTRNKAEAGCW